MDIDPAYQITEVVAGDRVLFRQSIPLHSLITAQEYPLFSHSGSCPLKEVRLLITANCKERLLDDIPSLVIANLCVSGILESPEVINEIHIIRRDSDAPIEVSLFSAS